MSPEGKRGKPREHTDESLRRERDRTDEALAEKRKAAEALVDTAIEHARERADEVLAAAREKADDKSSPDRPGDGTPDALARERTEEDSALQRERASADDSLRREREEQARILAELLPREREQTDRYLRTERELSDTALSHRDEFLGMVSHDLRNLLAGIAMRAKLIGKQASDSDEGRRTISGIDQIERYIARMNRLIGDLVDMAAIHAGRFTVRPVPGDVAEVLAEAVTAFADIAREQGISLTSVTHGQGPPAVFDRERMLQVIANLVSNAMRYTPRGGSVTIEAAHEGKEVRVSVIDPGAGIPEDMREMIFECYSQTCRNDHGGLGLGLYISRCIVGAHGGRIWAADNPAGAGAAIHFTIPASGGAGAPQPG